MGAKLVKSALHYGGYGTFHLMGYVNQLTTGGPHNVCLDSLDIVSI